MNIFQEIFTKLGVGRLYLDTPAEDKRPQDNVPVERITHYIVRDYRRMSLERQALITYIRNLESIYKATQMDLYRNLAKGSLSRKRFKQEITLILYNSTKEHLRAQQRLREALDRSNNTDEHHDNM